MALLVDQPMKLTGEPYPSGGGGLVWVGGKRSEACSQEYGLDRLMGQVTVLSGPERRRRWSDEERLQIVADAFAPGVGIAEVCRRYDVSLSLIYTWRRKQPAVYVASSMRRIIDEDEHFALAAKGG